MIHFCLSPEGLVAPDLQRKLPGRGVWVSAFDEWREIAKSGDDGVLFAAMLGRDEDAVRLRQSAPYAGLLSQEEVGKLNEEAAG